MTFDNRIELQHLLSSNIGVTECARRLKVAPSTISREIKRNRIEQGRARGYNDDGNQCRHRRDCSVKGLCLKGGCWNKRCRTCKSRYCHTICKLYEKEVCRIQTRSPYCCDGCSSVSGCKMHRYRYDANIAQRKADLRRPQEGTSRWRETLSFTPSPS